MKTKYKYIPVTFERVSEAVRAAEDGELFENDGTALKDWSYAAVYYCSEGLLFKRVVYSSVTEYVNLYCCNGRYEVGEAHDTEEEAKRVVYNSDSYVTTIKVERG